jgi:hypothetical protein
VACFVYAVWLSGLREWTVAESLAASLVDGTFMFEMCKLWVFCFRESLVSFERHSVSSYFYRLLEANTVGVRDTISLLHGLNGILLNFAAPFLRVMLLLDCTFLLFLYVLSPGTHTSTTYKGSRKS